SSSSGGSCPPPPVRPRPMPGRSIGRPGVPPRFVPGGMAGFVPGRAAGLVPEEVAVDCGAPGAPTPGDGGAWTGVIGAAGGPAARFTGEGVPVRSRAAAPEVCGFPEGFGAVAWAGTGGAGVFVTSAAGLGGVLAGAAGSGDREST